jgi:hypothetical protein
MTGVAMAKELKNDEPSDQAGEPAKKLSSLKVRQEDQQIIAKIAALRGLSIEALFMEKDVRTFFRHLLINETREEQERQKRHLAAEHPKGQR